MISKALKLKIIEQQFYPTTLGLFTNPFYFARKGLLQYMQMYAARLTGKVLDIGCGTKPYERLFTSVTTYVGLELDTPENRARKNAELFYDGVRFPCRANYFDGAVANQVLEHVFNPEEWIQEVNRVLKPGGLLLLTVPFIWDEYEQPHDFGRYSSFGLRALLIRNKFEIIEQKKSMNDIRAVFQLLAAYVYKKTFWLRRRHFDLLTTLIFIAPINVLGALCGLLTPVNDDLYLDNIVLARKK